MGPLPVQHPEDSWHQRWRVCIYQRIRLVQDRGHARGVAWWANQGHAGLDLRRPATTRLRAARQQLHKIDASLGGLRAAAAAMIRCWVLAAAHGQVAVRHAPILTRRQRRTSDQAILLREQIIYNRASGLKRWSPGLQTGRLAGRCVVPRQSRTICTGDRAMGARLNALYRVRHQRTNQCDVARASPALVVAEVRAPAAQESRISSAPRFEVINRHVSHRIGLSATPNDAPLSCLALASSAKQCTPLGACSARRAAPSPSHCLVLKLIKTLQRRRESRRNSSASCTLALAGAGPPPHAEQPCTSAPPRHAARPRGSILTSKGQRPRRSPTAKARG